MFQEDQMTLKNVLIRILHPPKREPIVEQVHNDFSLVMSISYGLNSFLLTGDIGKDVEKRLDANKNLPKSRILKSPHHGSNSSSSPEFIEAVSPEIVVISVGRGNRYGLPNTDVLARYSAHGAKVYRTDLHGAVEITATKQDISVRTALKPTQ
jgi:competence protein ComEC